MGSSSSTTSKRLSSSAASAARAACPPESEVISASGPTSRPSSASTGGSRSSRSGAPLASQWSRRGGVAVAAAGGRRRRPARRRPLHRGGRRGGAGAPGDVAADRLALEPLVLLGQPPDEGVAGRGRDRAAERLEVAGEDPQQRGLARAVGADHADHVAGRDGQVEGLEEGAVRVAAGQVLGDEGRAHRAIVVPRAGRRSTLPVHGRTGDDVSRAGPRVSARPPPRPGRWPGSRSTSSARSSRLQDQLLGLHGQGRPGLVGVPRGRPTTSYMAAMDRWTFHLVERTPAPRRPAWPTSPAAQQRLHARREG